MAGPSKVIVLDPDVRAGRQIQLGFQREGVSAQIATVPPDLRVNLPTEDAGLVVVGGSDARALDLVRRTREVLEANHADAPIVFAGRGTSRQELYAAGADEVLAQPAYLRDVVTIGRLMCGQPANHRTHLVGNLGEITGVLTLVRALSSLGRSAVLTLIRGLRRGEVRFFEGEVTSAQVGLIHGQAALHQLLLWTDARFDFHHEDIVRRQQIPLDRDELFADAEHFLAGVRDSSGSLSPAMVLEQDAMRIGALGKQIPTEVHGVLRMFDGHRVLADVLEDSPYRVFETLRVAQRALDVGLLRKASTPRPKATWRAVLAIEEWLVGAETKEDVVARGAVDNTAPVTKSSEAGKSKKFRRQKKKRRANTPVPIATPPAIVKGDIDWGALVPRSVGQEVGPLAGVVPAAQRSGEIMLPKAPSRDEPREKLEALMDTGKRERIFPTDIGLEPSVVLDAGAGAESDGKPVAPPPTAPPSSPTKKTKKQEKAEAKAKAKAEEEARARADAERAAAALALAQAAKAKADADAKVAADKAAAKAAADKAAADRAAADRAVADKAAADKAAADKAAADKAAADKAAADKAAADKAAADKAAADKAAADKAAADKAAADKAAADKAAADARAAADALAAAEKAAADARAAADALAAAKVTAESAADKAAADKAVDKAGAFDKVIVDMNGSTNGSSGVASGEIRAKRPTSSTDLVRALLDEERGSDITTPSTIVTETPSVTVAHHDQISVTRTEQTARLVATPEATVSEVPFLAKPVANPIAAKPVANPIATRSGVDDEAVTRPFVKPGAEPEDIDDEPSDGVIRTRHTTEETPPASQLYRRPPPGEIPADDRPPETVGEIRSRAPSTPPPIPSVASEPSILVADLQAAHSAVSAVAEQQAAQASTTPNAAAAAATPGTAAATASAEVAQVRRDATGAFTQIEEEFFRAGTHDEKQPAPKLASASDSFDDLDEGYVPLGFWDRLMGRKKPKK